MSGYTRNDTSNNIADGNVVNASDLDGEFDAIVSAFNSSTGHTHDGTSAEGAPIEKVGPVQDLVITATEVKPKTSDTLDLGTNLLLFKDLFIDGTATLGDIVIDNDGTIGSVSDTDAIAISSGGVVTFSQAPVINVENATTNAVTDVLTLRTQSTGTPAVGIGAGMLFSTETAAGTLETGGAIRIVTTGLTPTDEEIDLVFYSMRNGSLTEAFRYDSDGDTFDVTGSINADGLAVVTTGLGDTGISLNRSGSLRFDINTGVSGVTGDALVIEDSSANNYLTLRGGNVGIGTTNPSYKLHVRGADATANLVVGNTTEGTQLEVLTYQDDRVVLRSNDTSDTARSLAFETGTTERTRINSSGTLIHKAAAIFNEDGGDSDFRVESNNNANMLFVDGGNDRVGIGIGSPTSTLDVAKNDQANGATISITNSASSSTWTSGDIIGSLDYRITDGSASELVRGRIAVQDDASSSSTYPASNALVFSTTLLNTLTERTRITSVGQFKHQKAAVFNEEGGDNDFRVESNNYSDMLFVDAGNDTVTIANSQTKPYATSRALQFRYGSIHEDGNGYTSIVSGAYNSAVSNYKYRDTGLASSLIRLSFGNISFNNATSGTEDADITYKQNASFGVNESVFNEQSEDMDFRVESSINTHTLFVDAGASNVSINESSSYLNTFKISVSGTDSIPTGALIQSNDYQVMRIWNPDNSSTYSGIRLETRTSQASGWLIANEWGAFSGNLIFRGRDSGSTSYEALRLNKGGGAVFNDGSVDTDFRVESDSKPNMLFVDAGTNAVGINSSNPGATVSFADTTVTPNFAVNSNGEVNGPLFEYDGSGVFMAMANDLGSGTRYYISFGDSDTTRYGDITSNGSVMTYGGTSDYRLKTNVQSMSGSIDRVKQLNPVTFDWISSGVSTEGFIAHELQSVVPDAATGVKDEVDDNGQPIMQQVDPRHIVPLLTGALKEAIAKIESLEARVAQLEAN